MRGRCSRACTRCSFRMLDWPVPVLVAVQGQCLGGGLELALAGILMFAAPDARLGQPEIKARRVRAGGVLPAAGTRSARRAPRICCSPGRIDRAPTRRCAMGLVDAVADDPGRGGAGLFRPSTWRRRAQASLRSPSRRRAAATPRVQAARTPSNGSISTSLMKTHDAVEGLERFHRQRPRKWEHR